MSHELCSLIPFGVRTVASSSLGFAACLSKNPDFSQSSELPLFTKGLLFYPKLRNIFGINFTPILTLINAILCCSAALQAAFGGQQRRHK